ncbi:adenylosuccinate synthetase [Saccharothrix sp. NRRL B-16314]|uniref:adenylosuccinate synthetase n=1 Tax=Saccharothrix sp. NRRL B-16314 TaxID=1463825 RepID=UPI0005242992|nr:adenylosuccinate synthetase [Saccharothrix sp. NRRL B-16314]
MEGHIIVVGLGFGDEGKGAVVDALCHDGAVTAVVRFNGGAQAAHNVVVGDRHHTFSQFGAGTLAGVPTHLSRHVLVEPIALAGESEDLAALGVADPLRLLSIDADALLTTPLHVAANRAREDARGHSRHGSCGKGIGETAWYALLAERGAVPGDTVEHQRVLGVPGPPPTVGDCARPSVLRSKLDALARFYEPLIGAGTSVDDLVALYRDFAGAVRVTTGDEVGRLADRGRLVFEGAQGVLLDQWRGFHPHTTWSTVTPDNARDLLGHRRATVIGVTRTYQTRHGAGPFPTEDRTVPERFPERHNGTGEYQGSWRAGHLDAVLLRYAVAACGGVDALAVTHLDVGGLKVATSYDAPLPSARLTEFLFDRTPTLVDMPDPVAWLEEDLGVPVLITGAGPDRADYAVRTPVRR